VSLVSMSKCHKLLNCKFNNKIIKQLINYSIICLLSRGYNASISKIVIINFHYIKDTIKALKKSHAKLIA